MDADISQFQRLQGVMFLMFVFSVLVNIALTIFWMVLAWRAVSAHEKIATALAHFTTRDERAPREMRVAHETWDIPPPMPSKDTIEDSNSPEA